MKYRLLIVLLLVLILGCSKKTEYDNAKAKLEKLKSYEALVEVDIYGNKGVSHYKTQQFFMEPNLIRIETISPSFLKGKILIFDGNKYYIFHPIINQKYSIEKVKDDDAFIFMGIIDKRIFLTQDAKYSYKKIDEKEYISIKVNLEESSPYRKYAEIYVDKETLLPKILVLYDDKENLRVNINFTEFKYNKAIDDKLFKGI
ncbi:Outer-membrane lipoprotein carrier protein [Caloramator mitchellensis]|uniref:Outer-membrane lipoprotein carrier protein n=1 Tax=Caloramator mitchellensis TaxID=908809 RepID=A0A0R3JUA8_CALMK|nr:outer-membrane lipoprotein carrier protein LolA [Caloramator mitchellensis]KRQ87131.1 Outer-membrane lipoprotein carrier protein [Caloramator mitchellensis]